MKSLTILQTILAAVGLWIGVVQSALALPALPTAESPVDYTVGNVVADPTRNLVYLVDQTDNLILKIDTSIGLVTGSVAIEDGMTTGSMVVSTDGSKLYLAESAEDKILIFSLPDLTPLTSVSVEFSPESIAVGTGDRLYCAEASSNAISGFIVEVNTADGSVVQTFGTHESYYGAPNLRMDPSGTTLYAETQGDYIYSYDISGASASSATSYQYYVDNLVDYSPDDTYNRVYLMNNGEASGINVLNTTNDNYSTAWPLGQYGDEAVSFSPSGTVVFGASPGDVKSFSRTDGAPLTDNTIVPEDEDILDTIISRGLAATPNGNAVYVRGSTLDGRFYVGIVGLNHFNPTGLPCNLPFQNGEALGFLNLDSSFLPTAWTSIGAMGSGWQERAMIDINSDGIPDLIFQNGTNIGALIMNADGSPRSWVGIGGMNVGWQLRGAADITGGGAVDLIFQNGTSLGFLSITNSGYYVGNPNFWSGIGAMGQGWELRAVADLNNDGQPELIFQNGTSIGALEVGTNGLPVSWTGIGAMSPGWVLGFAADMNEDGQPDLLFQNGIYLGALQVNTSMQPVSWTGVGGLGAGWVAPGNY